jgi:hypothetical protein
MTGWLPPKANRIEPILRRVSKAHPFAYEKRNTPEQTRRGLQILPHWDDCSLEHNTRPRMRAMADSLPQNAHVAWSD